MDILIEDGLQIVFCAEGQDAAPVSIIVVLAQERDSVVLVALAIRAISAGRAPAVLAMSRSPSRLL
jgi:hypothetical protein